MLWARLVVLFWEFMTKLNEKAAPAGPLRAMLLAAGKGERMRPLTDIRPKPLIKVAGRPLIDHALDRLAAAGVTEVVVNLHYRADMLRDHLRDRQAPRIVFSDETTRLLDTGGGVVNALPLLGDAPFFVHNCDSFWLEGVGSTLARMIARWDPERMDALMLVAPLVSAIGFDGPGDYAMDGCGRLTRNRERIMAPFAYCGVQICSPALFADAPEGPFSTVRLWDRAEEAGRLFGLRLDGEWFHVGTPAALALTEQRLLEQ